ncbi:MAG TPA: hypothetical protein PKJ47_04975 [Candidatus Limiplasma sp.]|nr:hypothetical protein [Candidatus Limiplasma sp.]
MRKRVKLILIFFGLVLVCLMQFIFYSTISLAQESIGYSQSNLNQYINDPAVDIETLPLNAIKNRVEKYRDSLFVDYRRELVAYGCMDEATIDFCAKVLYALDNDSFVSQTASRNGNPRLKDCVTHEQILMYSVTKHELDVIVNKDNNPRILLLNTTPEVDQGIKDAINWFINNGAPDILESMYYNGLCIIMPIYDPHHGFFLFENGVITPEIYKNANRELLPYRKDGGLCQNFIRGFLIEPYGIAHDQIQQALSLPILGLEQNLNVEIVKGYLGSYTAYQLLMNNHDVTYAILADPLEGESFMESYARGEILNTETFSDKQFKLAELFMKANLIDPIGFDNWTTMEEYNKLNEYYHIELEWLQYPTDLCYCQSDFFFCAKLLSAIDNAFSYSRVPSNTAFQAADYFDRNSIVDYFHNGKGLNIIYNPAKRAGLKLGLVNQQPVICISHCTSNLEKQFRTTLKNISKEHPNIWSVLVKKVWFCLCKIKNFLEISPALFMIMVY